MIPKPHNPFLSGRSANWLPWAVLVVGCVVSVLAALMVRRGQNQAEGERFMRQVVRMETAIQNRFHTVSNLLHGARAFELSSEAVTELEWARYFRNVQAQFTNGIVGLGYVQRIARADVDAFEQQVRASGLKDFTVERTGEGDWLYVVTAIEPQDKNTGVLGLDVASGRVRREAAETAARDDKLVLSRRIRLDYETGVVPGFLLFLPIYDKGADIAATPPAERLRVTQGWAYASIRVDELLADMPLHTATQLDIAVYERGGKAEETLLHDTRIPRQSEKAYEAAFTTTRVFNVLGRDWSVTYYSTEDFDRLGVAWISWGIGAGGILAALLSAVLTGVLVDARGQAIKLAERMTESLRVAEQESRRLALVASRTATAVILMDPDWKVQWTNDSYTRLFGYTLEETKGKRPGDFLFGPESRAGIRDAIDEACENNRIFQDKVLLYRKDGGHVWVQLEVQPLRDEQGRITGYMGLHTDITSSSAPRPNWLTRKPNSALFLMRCPWA